MFTNRSPIHIIYACDLNGGIGINNLLPWPKLPRDMKFFKDHTSGYSTVIVGRKTYESIPNKLAGRNCYVVTNNPSFETKKEDDSYGPLFTELWDPLSDEENREISRIKKSLDRSLNVFHSPVIVIGGKRIFEQFLPFTTRLYVTEVEGVFECDTYFSPHKQEDWAKQKEIFRDSIGLEDGKRLNYSCSTYRRKLGYHV